MINKLQERALRLINDDQKSNFEDLICKNKENTIHQRNLHALMIEVTKVINNIAPSIANSLFFIREIVHNIRNFQILSSSIKKQYDMVLKQRHIDHLS